MIWVWAKRKWFFLFSEMWVSRLLARSVQIASVLGYLGSAKYGIYPCLVVVPNSYVMAQYKNKTWKLEASAGVLINIVLLSFRTITNWVREFEKWSPHLRVVRFFSFSLWLYTITLLAMADNLL